MPKLAKRLPQFLVALLTLALGLSVLQAKPLNVPVVYYKLPNGLKVVISEDHAHRGDRRRLLQRRLSRQPKGRTGLLTCSNT